MSLVEPEDGVPPAVARQLQVIAFAMGAGLALMAGLVFWAHHHAAAAVPSPAQVKSINALTAVMMGVALALIVASELAWRFLLRGSARPLSGRLQAAFIARLACREGAGLLGLTVAYIAAISGVLRVYPAYWVNLAPFALFLVFLASHWPTEDRLAAEARDALGENPSFLKK
ncbi:MAG: hypothetical protein Q8T11_13060 [Elusimicrobiota bacterium]|nr:hypothetical protein [Elusimicrobiota bacterium]